MKNEQQAWEACRQCGSIGATLGHGLCVRCDEAPIEVTVHAKSPLAPQTATALAAMILHACPEIEYRRQAKLAPMLVAEIERLSGMKSPSRSEP